MDDRDPRELDGAWMRHQSHSVAAPAEDLAPFVERYWTASWDYATPYRQKIVPYPNVHVTVRPGRPVEVHGVARRHVIRVLEGTDRVVGAAFRPGAFRAFLGAPLTTLTDRTVPAADLPALTGGPAEPLAIHTLERWLRSRLPCAGPDAAGRAAGAAVALAAADPSITRVNLLATAVGRSVRSLQRLFAEHVGVGPKWVIRRYRLHEVTERLTAGAVVDWADIAAELGYADQAHLARDVADLVGEPPTHYARRYPTVIPRA